MWDYKLYNADGTGNFTSINMYTNSSGHSQGVIIGTFTLAFRGYIVTAGTADLGYAHFAVGANFLYQFPFAAQPGQSLNLFTSVDCGGSEFRLDNGESVFVRYSLANSARWTSPYVSGSATLLISS